MTSTSPTPTASLWRRTAVAIAAAASCAGAQAALPPFTLDPSAAGLAGSSFTADNVLISDYSTLTFTSATTFQETGYLPVSGFQLGGNLLLPAGLNSTWGLYFSYTGTGTTSSNNPTAVPTVASFDTLTYELRGYNGSATFGVNPVTHVPTETASGEVVLATGTLISGTASTVPNSTNTNFSPTANVELTFTPEPAYTGFFAAPTPFFELAFSSFTNTSTQVTPFAGGFSITQGGGAVNFATAVPEPETYALMLAGLGALGFLARRRTR